MKETVLKAYELVPEAYRQKFRNLKRKPSNQTYVEFARDKMNLYDRWLQAMNVNGDFTKLREVMLMEEFKECVPNEVKTYLSDRNVKKIEEASVMSDDFVLSHKFVFDQSKQWFRKGSRNKSPESESKSTTGSETSTSRLDKPDTPASQGNRSKSSRWERPVCSFCHKIGHTYEKCFKRKNQLEQKPVTLVAQRSESSLSVAADDNKVLSARSNDGYDDFITSGRVAPRDSISNFTDVCILRDTGAAQSLIVEDVLPSGSSKSQNHVLIKGVGGSFQSVPLHTIFLESELKTGSVSVGVVPSLPVEGVTFLLGNDLAGSKVRASSSSCVHLTSSPCYNEDTERLKQVYPGIFPACVTTRSMTRVTSENTDERKDDESQPKVIDHENVGRDDDFESFQLAETFMTDLQGNQDNHPSDPAKFDKIQLIKEQESDPDLQTIVDSALCVKDAEKVPVCYFKSESGVLMRKWRPPDVSADDEWRYVYQIVVPKCHHAEILKVAHEQPMSVHLGVRKTQSRIMRHFYWPGIHRDVSNFCKTCHTCQMVGKPNQKIPIAPNTSVWESF